MYCKRCNEKWDAKQSQPLTPGYTVDGSTSDKLIKLMEAPYEKTLAVHRRGDWGEARG